MIVPKIWHKMIPLFLEIKTPLDINCWENFENFPGSGLSGGNQRCCSNRGWKPFHMKNFCLMLKGLLRFSWIVMPGFWYKVIPAEPVLGFRFVSLSTDWKAKNAFSPLSGIVQRPSRLLFICKIGQSKWIYNGIKTNLLGILTRIAFDTSKTEISYVSATGINSKVKEKYAPTGEVEAKRGGGGGDEEKVISSNEPINSV